jgi:predicted dehydrogenase
MEQIGFGIAGVVGRGRDFISPLAANRHARVVALCDLQEQAVAQIAAEAGVGAVYTEYERMLDEGGVDAVIVATPMFLHAPQAIMALQRDIHVLSEVSACTSLDQARQLVAACRASRGLYMMAEDFCYMRPNMLVRAMARAGLFGELYFAEGQYLHELKDHSEATPWRRQWHTGINGCTYPTHSLGPVLQWLDEGVVAVLCTGSGHHYRDPRGDLYENEDTTTMVCRTASGGLIQIRVDMISNRPHTMDYYSLQGTTGCYESARGLGDQPKVWLANRCKELEWRPLEDFAEEFLPEEWRHPSPELLQAGHGGGDYLEVQGFIRAIVDGTPPPIGIHEAMDMTLPGLVSQESIVQGGTWLPVPDAREWPS